MKDQSSLDKSTYTLGVLRSSNKSISETIGVMPDPAASTANLVWFLILLKLKLPFGCEASTTSPIDLWDKGLDNFPLL